MKQDHNLDERLAERGQQVIRSWVNDLPEDVPSLSWRSELNEKIFVVAAKRAKRTWQSLIWRPALGLVVTGCLAFVFLIRTAPVPVSTAEPSLEAHLVEQYKVDRASTELVNYSYANAELQSASLPKPDPDLSEADLESL